MKNGIGVMHYAAKGLTEKVLIDSCTNKTFKRVIVEQIDLAVSQSERATAKVKKT